MDKFRWATGGQGRILLCLLQRTQLLVLTVSLDHGDEFQLATVERILKDLLIGCKIVARLTVSVLTD